MDYLKEFYCPVKEDRCQESAVFEDHPPTDQKNYYPLPDTVQGDVDLTPTSEARASRVNTETRTSELTSVADLPSSIKQNSTRVNRPSDHYGFGRTIL